MLSLLYWILNRISVQNETYKLHLFSFNLKTSGLTDNGFDKSAAADVSTSALFKASKVSYFLPIIVEDVRGSSTTKATLSPPSSIQVVI